MGLLIAGLEARRRRPLPGRRLDLRRAGFEILAISLDHALAAGSLPGPHKGPFDRMLIAQARSESLPVASRDPVFRDYGVQVIW